MPDPFSTYAQILDDYFNAKFEKFEKKFQSYVKNYVFGPEQIKPGAVIGPKLGDSADTHIINVVTPAIAEINELKITTFYQDDTPTATTIGDLWIDTNSGNKLFRWNGTEWLSVDNSQLQEALIAAGDAQATADGKILTFAQVDPPTASAVGDLWIDTNDNNKLYRWNGSAWAVVQDGLIAAHSDALISLSSSVSSKTTVYYQTSAPASKGEGDVWYDTDADPVVIYRWNGSAWTDITTAALSAALAAANTAQATADGKIRSFAQTSAPTGMVLGDVGDLWVDTDNNNKLYRWSGTAWVSIQDGLIASHSTAILSLSEAVTAKTTVYYQTSAPTAPTTGDIWYDTDASPVVIYRWNGDSWADITTDALSSALAAAADAQSIADGKIRTFAQTSSPTNMTASDVGDLWVDTDNNNKLYRYNGSAWVSVQGGLISSHSSAIASLNSSLAAKTTVYYQVSAPTTPVIGDVWYDTDADPVVINRWSGSIWEDITTAALSAALSAANTAQATADGKIRTFAQTTAPTGMSEGDVGDLWVDTNDNNKLYRWNGSSWISVQDGLIASHSAAIATLSSSIDEKTTIFYQTSAPASPTVGDIWYDTDENPVKIYRWSGTVWNDITSDALGSALAAAADAQAIADGKIKTYAQTSQPTGMAATDVGDLWVDTDDNNKLYRYSGSAWIAVQDTHNDSSIADLTDALSSKTTIFYQTSAPVPNAIGDIWYDTDAAPVTIYRWSGSAWVDITTSALSAALEAAGDAQATADGKINSYAQATAPTGLVLGDIGDIWIDTDDNNKLYRWDGSSWVSAYGPAIGIQAPGMNIVSGEVDITASILSINVSGTNGDMTLDERGLSVGIVNSPSVAQKYTGASTLYVSKSATDAEVAAGTHFRSVKEAMLAVDSMYLPYSVTINITQDSYYDNEVYIGGVCGAGSVTIVGNDATLCNTRFSISGCTAAITVSGLHLTQRSTNANGYAVYGCNFVLFISCIITALSGTTTSYSAIRYDGGCRGRVVGCEFYGAWRAVTAINSLVTVAINKGNCKHVSDGSILLSSGAQPDSEATYAPVLTTGGQSFGTATVDQGTASAPPTQVSTLTFAATMTRTVYGSTLWPGSWKSTTNEIWQGYTTGMEYQASLLWFSGLASLSGKTILAAKLRIRRVPGSGKGDAVKLIGYYGDRSYNAGSGSPSNRVSMGTIGNISERNSLSEFSIPVAAISYLSANAGGRCIALNPGDSSVLSGKTYSSNYAKFSGIGSSYVPELVVTYS